MTTYMPHNSPWHPQPPEIEDPGSGTGSKPWEPGEEDDDAGMDPQDGQEDDEPQQPRWIKRARDSLRFSTSYIDSNYRKQWDDSIRAFYNRHPSDSKYNSELFKKRSSLYRPKTRAIIRKNEAAAAAAYFSNLELISIDPINQSLKEELAAGEVMEQIMKYRLTESIPWFLIMMGAIQDSQVQGACVAHIYWKFCEKTDKRGRVTSKIDQPCIDLVPIENIRIDPSASWLDPIGTSPYLIHLIPMYWCDVKDRMEYADPKGRRWKKIPASLAFGHKSDSDDSTRQARLGTQQDPGDQSRDISDYDIVWIHRHIHRWNGDDWEFYTLASEVLLTEAVPLRDSVWHGERPYVMGRAIVETHKPIPTSLPMLVKGLQEEANEISNQRMDNVKFVLNKAYMVKRGKNVDLSSLVRNVPGRITLVDDPENDVKVMDWKDVTQSSYLEQDRLDGDFNDIAGNFSPMQVQTQRTPRESTHTMKMLQAPSNLMTEYMLKCHTETFAQPVLRQVMLLEQHYETDQLIMAVAGEKAKIAHRYGINEVTDEMMDRHMTLGVNVGMGATDPVMKLQRFVYAVQSFAAIAKQPPPGFDLKAIAKEMFGLSGYQDGSRFMIDGMDPEVVFLIKQNQQLMQQLKMMGMQLKNKEGANIAKIQANKDTAESRERIAHHSHITKLITEQMKHAGSGQDDFRNHVMEIEMHQMEMDQMEQERSHQQQLHDMDLQRQQADHQQAGQGQQQDREHADQQHQQQLQQQQQLHEQKLAQMQQQQALGNAKK